ESGAYRKSVDRPARADCRSDFEPSAGLDSRALREPRRPLRRRPDLHPPHHRRLHHHRPHRHRQTHPHHHAFPPLRPRPRHAPPPPRRPPPPPPPPPPHPPPHPPPPRQPPRRRPPPPQPPRRRPRPLPPRRLGRNHLHHHVSRALLLRLLHRPHLLLHHQR